ncbi:site-specific integrase, partial [Shewanella schlegeliana]
KICFGKITKKTADDYYYIITLILDLFGHPDLNEMDRENAEIIRNALRQYPKNKSKYKEFNSLVGFDVIYKNIELKKETLSPRSIRKIINAFSGFSEWCVSHEHINKNYFYKLQTLPPRHDDVRYEFSDEQLSLIFKMEQYIKEEFKHPYYYWLPLLLRFTGARLNELCQLLKGDIVLKDGIYCIEIREQLQEQSVKNKSSTRTVPLHKAIIERGFINFVEQCNSDRVFPELPLVRGYYSHNASKWFSRRREKLGLSKGLDAHSFRHSFVNELKQKGIKIEIIKCIVGHSNNCITLDIYGKQYPPKTLIKVINNISDSHVKHIKPYNI